ncbi:MAG: hypothetical protein ABI343_03115 [Burkholderiaceae bacterium]
MLFSYSVKMCQTQLVWMDAPPEPLIRQRVAVLTEDPPALRRLVVDLVSNRLSTQEIV